MERAFLGLCVLVVLSLLVGCGGGGASTIAGPPPLGGDSIGDRSASSAVVPAGSMLELSGRVVGLSDKSGVSGATVSIGQTQRYSGISGDDGAFTISLPAGATVSSLYATTPCTFSIDTDSNSDGTEVAYGRGLYPQDQIPVPQEVLSGQSTDLGAIVVVGDGSDYFDRPPPPPGFDDESLCPPPPPPI